MKRISLITIIFFALGYVIGAASPSSATCYNKQAMVQCPSGQLDPDIIPTIPESKVTNLTSDLSSKVSTADLTSTLANYQTTAGMTGYATTATLTNYATTATLSNYQTTAGMTAYETTAGLTATLTNYATTATLSNYQTTAGMTGYETTAGLTSTLTNYATTATLSNYQTTAGMTGYATTATLSNYQTTAGMTGYATTATLTNYATTATLSNYQTTAGMSAYETTAALVSTLANYQTTAGMTGYVTTTDSRLSDSRAPTGSIYVGGGISLTTGTNTISATNAALANSPKLTVSGVTEAMQTLSDTTDKNVSTSAHGYIPKCPGGGTTYFRDDCTWATPSGGGSTLTTVYEVDFSTLTSITTGTTTTTTTNILAGGDNNKIIDGKTWSMNNSANLGTASIHDGVHAGLYMKCNSNNSNNYDTTFSGGTLFAKLSALSSSAAMQNYTVAWVWFMVSQPHTPNANYEAAHYGVFYGPSSWNIANSSQSNALRSYSGSLAWNAQFTPSSNTSLYSPAASSTSFDVVAIRLMANTAAIYLGTSSGGDWPSVSSLEFTGVTTASTSVGITGLATEWRVYISVRSGNSAAASDVLLKKLRVQTK